MAVKKTFSPRHGREVWAYDVRINGRHYRKLGFSSEPAAETETADARFMLDYLHRLTRAVEEDEPDALKSITFTIPLTEQSVVKHYLFA
jgi:hypothetical protein